MKRCLRHEWRRNDLCAQSYRECQRCGRLQEGSYGSWYRVPREAYITEMEVALGYEPSPRLSEVLR